MGIIDILRVDTTPGQYPDNPFSPPAGWDGDGWASWHSANGGVTVTPSPVPGQDMEAIIASVISRLAVRETTEEDANG